MSAASKLWIALLLLCFAASSLFAATPESRAEFVAANMLAGALVVLLWRRNEIELRTIVLLALVMRLAYLWLPPVLSDDVFRYMWDGLLQSRGVNPYAFTPDDPRLSFLHHEPVYPALNSASYYSVYPPLSQFVFRLGAWFYSADWQANYYVIKGLLAASEAGALVLLARTLPARSLMLYAWNPLVVLVAAGQAHTESLAVLCLVGTWLFARNGRGGWASVALAGAGLVKLYPFVLFPLLWRRFGWRSVWPGMLATAALSVPYAHPDALPHVFASLDLYVRSFEFNAGVYYAVKKAFEIVTGADWSKQIGPAFRWLFLLSLPLAYLLDRRLNMTFRGSAVAILGLFFAFSTTIHPWYLLPLLALTAVARPPSWHWHWLGVASIGTYLLYVGGPYWLWVIIGWAGWGILVIFRYAEPALHRVMRLRARKKADLILRHVPRLTGADVLDLGAAEGYVGSELRDRTHAAVVLADIRNLNRTKLAHVVFDGRHLPFDDDVFDVVLLVFVLHHAADPTALLGEARRVCKGRIIVIESIYANSLQRAVLSMLDRMANFARSGGAIKMWSEPLHFDTFSGWIERFRAVGADVQSAHDLGGMIHRRAIYVLAP